VEGNSYEIHSGSSSKKILLEENQSVSLTLKSSDK
jgi:hypothetical protein